MDLYIGGQHRPRANTRFRVGGPCKFGHSGKRYVSSGDCVECHRAKCRTRHGTPEGRVAQAKRSREHKWRALDLTPERRHFILAGQNFQCAICKTDEPGGSAAEWHTDHCHRTNAVRGLLCQRCNMGLGLFKDSVDALNAAAEYLQKDHE